MKTYAEIAQYIRDASDPDDGVDMKDARKVLERALADDHANISNSEADSLRADLVAAYALHEGK